VHETDIDEAVAKAPQVPTAVDAEKDLRLVVGLAEGCRDIAGIELPPGPVGVGEVQISAVGE
jgi:hypothetical protein